uniref:R13L1/DRL21-like LRR repeat region domain-containing protein n=2 Tax=Chenopodium quinoa TaxID=63459 RepID=A0A803MIH2_CHEQI
MPEIPKGMLNLKRLRTFLLPEQIYDGSTFSKSICKQITTRFSCLRVLDLHNLHLKSLPSSIGKLIHLRFLNLSHTDIEELPDSITNLHNLQTLNLYECLLLRTPPKDIRKLTNLRNLNVASCYNLTYMPSGLAGLTLLNRLPMFIVNYEYLAHLRYKPNSTTKLSDLKELNNLRGDLYIKIHRDFEKNMLEEAMEANLSNKQWLTELRITFNFDYIADNICNYHDEDVLEGLKPHSNLRKLWIERYKGQKLPRWARGDLCITLPSLVEIILKNCNCQQVPIFSQLRFLKRLEIMCMDNVEYIENNGVCDTSYLSSKSQGMQTLFFPSLEVLRLTEMKKLKGWWKVEEIESTNDSESTLSSELVGTCQQYGHHQLSMQTIFFPSLEELRLKAMKKLKGWWKGVEAIENTTDSESTLSSKLVGTGQQYDHHQLSMQFCNLSKLHIFNCPELKFLPLCPKVEVLRLIGTNERLSVLKMATSLSTTTASTSSGSGRADLKLKKLTMDNVEDQLMSLPKQYLQHLSSLIVACDRKLVNTESLGEAFQTLIFFSPIFGIRVL